MNFTPASVSPFPLGYFGLEVSWKNLHSCEAFVFVAGIMWIIVGNHDRRNPVSCIDGFVCLMTYSLLVSPGGSLLS